MFPGGIERDQWYKIGIKNCLNTVNAINKHSRNKKIRDDILKLMIKVRAALGVLTDYCSLQKTNCQTSLTSRNKLYSLWTGIYIINKLLHYIVDILSIYYSTLWYCRA